VSFSQSLADLFGYGDGFYCITSTLDDELYVAGDTISYATAGFTDNIYLVIDAPIDITLTPNSINENVASGTLVGTLLAEDPDQESGHSFELIEGNGIEDADNDVFSISGDSLIINTSPDYETQQEYYIYVRVTDEDSKTFDKALIIYVNDVQESEPTELALKGKKKNKIKVYPNPFNQGTTIEYEIQTDSQIAGCFNKDNSKSVPESGSPREPSPALSTSTSSLPSICSAACSMAITAASSETSYWRK